MISADQRREEKRREEKRREEKRKNQLDGSRSGKTPSARQTPLQITRPPTAY